MTPEDRVVCLCCRQTFEARHQLAVIELCQSQPIRWDLVLSVATLHQVSPIVHRNLSSISNEHLHIPPAVINRFAKAHYHNILTRRKTQILLERILAFFSQKNIRVMLVKGEAFSRLIYQQPWHTVCHDIDLVIHARERELTVEDRREIVDFLEGMNSTRREFEEHIEYDFFEHHDVTMNNLLPMDWQRIWAEAETIQIDGYEALVLPIEGMLISAAINSCRKRFYRLKSLYDIATILDSCPDLNWDTVIRRAHDYKCNTILYTALLVTRSALGCQLPDNVLDDLKVNPLRASLIQFLVNRLSKWLTLSDLFVRSKNATLERTFSWSLLLTYATYRIDLLGPKLAELYSSWRNPSPEGSFQT